MIWIKELLQRILFRATPQNTLRAHDIAQTNEHINRLALVCKAWWYAANSADAVMPRTVTVNDENSSAWSPWWRQIRVMLAGSNTCRYCCSEVSSLTLLPAYPVNEDNDNQLIRQSVLDLLQLCGPHLVELDMSAIDAAPFLLRVQEACTSIQALWLNSIKINPDICALAGMPLESLSLEHVIEDTAYWNDGVRKALSEQWQLSRLCIGCCEEFHDLHMELLLGPIIKSSRACLTHLELVSGRFGDALLVQAVQHCHNLEYLNLNDCTALTEAGVIVTVSACKQLRHINLSGLTETSDSTVSCIATNCRHLKTLGLYCCNKVSEVGFRSLGEHCTKLSSINLGCHTITSDALKARG